MVSNFLKFSADLNTSSTSYFSALERFKIFQLNLNGVTEQVTITINAGNCVKEDKSFAFEMEPNKVFLKVVT